MRKRLGSVMDIGRRIGLDDETALPVFLALVVVAAVVGVVEGGVDGGVCFITVTPASRSF